MSDIYNNPYTAYTATPGVGDWNIRIDLSGLDAAAGTLSAKATVGGFTVNGNTASVAKDLTETTASIVVPITAAAGEAVVVTVQSNLAADGAGVTVASAATKSVRQTADHTANVALILADTNELQTDWVDAGRLDAILDDVLDRVQNIVNVGGSVNTAAATYLLTTGTESANAYTDTAPLNGTRHTHTDVGNEMDLYYQFAIGGDGVPTSVTVTGALTGSNDDLEVHAYNWVGTSWDRIGTIEGLNQSGNRVFNFDLYASHVGTGANVGLVRIRFTDGAYTLSTATLYVDQIFVSYAIVNRSVGYEGGAVWIDTNASNTNTESFVDGTADNPVSTLAAATTIAGNVNIKRFNIVSGSSITLAQSYDNYELVGERWTLALGGRSISNAEVCGATISGICTGANPPLFAECYLGVCTIPPASLRRCALTDAASSGITFGSAGSFFFEQCYSGVAGNGSPIITWDGGGTSKANFRHWSGGLQFEGMVAGETASIEGWGQFIEGTCTAGLVTIRGNLTTSGISNITLTDDARYDVDQINAECDTALSDYGANTTVPDVAGTAAGLHTTTDGKIDALNDFDPASDGVLLADAEDVYHADVFLTRDGLNSRDEYTVVWYKNGSPIISGITVPVIYVVKRSDGSNLIESTALTEIGSTGTYKLDSSTRLTGGEAAIAVVVATIDGASRAWARVIGRDV